MDVVDAIYDVYGEKPGKCPDWNCTTQIQFSQSTRLREDQGQIQSRGNEYLDKVFPLLSYIDKSYENGKAQAPPDQN